MVCDRAPFVRAVRCLTAAKTPSTGFAVRRRSQCSAGKSKNAVRTSRSFAGRSTALGCLDPYFSANTTTAARAAARSGASRTSRSAAFMPGWTERGTLFRTWAALCCQPALPAPPTVPPSEPGPERSRWRARTRRSTAIAGRPRSSEGAAVSSTASSRRKPSAPTCRVQASRLGSARGPGACPRRDGHGARATRPARRRAAIRGRRWRWRSAPRASCSARSSRRLRSRMAASTWALSVRLRPRAFRRPSSRAAPGPTGRAGARRRRARAGGRLSSHSTEKSKPASSRSRASRYASRSDRARRRPPAGRRAPRGTASA